MNCKTCRWWTRLTIGEAPSIAYYDFARANEPSSTGTCRGGATDAGWERRSRGRRRTRASIAVRLPRGRARDGRVTVDLLAIPNCSKLGIGRLAFPDMVSDIRHHEPDRCRPSDV